MTKYEQLLDYVRESEILYIKTESSRIPAQSMKSEPNRQSELIRDIACL